LRFQPGPPKTTRGAGRILGISPRTSGFPFLSNCAHKKIAGGAERFTTALIA
jgi:hypothetical protein